MIESADDLMQYIKLELGHPVIKINVAPEQMLHAINIACDKFIEWHRDGSRRAYFIYQITEDDVIKGFIPTPKEITDVVELTGRGTFSIGNGGGDGNFATDSWQYVSNMFKAGGDCATGGIISLSQFVMLKQKMSMINNIIGGGGSDMQPFEFAKYKRAIYPFFDYKAGDVVTFSVYESVDPRQAENVHAWNDLWLKQYATQHVKRIWATNLQKFGDMALPGGETLNGDTLYDQAATALEDLEEKLRDEHMDMALPFFG